MACTSGTINFTKYLTTVKFNQNQIRNFYTYFKKFSSGLDTMRYEEFRNSLGVIGYNCGEFICHRLFDLIKHPKDNVLTFENYLKFLNLVNNGTAEEKLKHSFRFMDVENKGFVDKENFKKTVFALCEFFEKVSQTQSKLKHEDIDFIFKEILIKTERSILDFQEYVQLVSNYPEIFDFFDIFNSKLVENSMIILNRENFGRLKNISDKMKSLLTKVDMINLKYGEVTLALTNFLEKAVKKEKKLEKLMKINRARELKETRENNKRYEMVDVYDNSSINKSLLNSSFATRVKENYANFRNKPNTNKTMRSNLNNETDIHLNNLENNPKKKLFYLSEKVGHKDETFIDDEIEVSDISDEKDIALAASPNNVSRDDFLNDESKSEKFLNNFWPVAAKSQPPINNQNSPSNKQINLKNTNNIDKSSYLSYNRSNTAYVSNKNGLPLAEIKPSYTYSETKEFDEKSDFSNVKRNKEIENPMRTNEKFSEFYKEKNFSFMKRDEFFGQSLEFDFLTPAPILHSELSNAFKDYELDPQNCLIINNKKNFIKLISDINDALKNVLNDIDPSKKNKKRRAAISRNVTLTNTFEKDDYLNPSFLKAEDEGLIHFGNPNVELVLNMMIGIRNSINSIGETKRLFHIAEKDEAFKELNRFKFSQNTYEKEFTCTFYDHAPKIFSNIRKMYGISNQNYLKSLGPENFLGNLILTKNRSLRELCSTGKSGSFFYYSYDSKFVLKTISLTEFEFFKNILEDYYFYIQNNNDTLIQRFYGLHSINFNDEKIYIVIMNNVFNTNIKVHYKYDLKGSTHQRISRKVPEINYENYNYSIPLKDLDFIDREEAICVSEEEKAALIAQLGKDSEFLSSKNINDYSLLIGIHNDEFFNRGTNNGADKSLLFDFLKMNTTNPNILSPLEKNKKSEDVVMRKPFYESNNGGMISRDGKKIYFFGIIDIFTQYG